MVERRYVKPLTAGKGMAVPARTRASVKRARREKLVENCMIEVVY